MQKLEHKAISAADTNSGGGAVDALRKTIDEAGKEGWEGVSQGHTVKQGDTATLPVVMKLPKAL